MAAYSQRHYGIDTWRLTGAEGDRRALHGVDSFSSAYNTFAADVADSELHELPGTCAHFVIDRDGTIYQLVSLTTMCRHTVGLNYTAIGIEHVGTSDAAILGNPRQLGASLRLTAWLMGRYGIQLRNVIGHNESLTSPYHHELYRAWRCQTHGDWNHADMNIYRAASRRPGPPLPRSARAGRQTGRYLTADGAGSVLLHSSYIPIRRITTRRTILRAAMRRFVPIMLVFCTALPCRRRRWAMSAAAAPATARSSSTTAAAASIIRARGGIIGRFDSGRLMVEDPVAGDGTGPIVYGAEQIRDLGRQRDAVHRRGRPLPHDRRPVHACTILAVGIDVSAVGRGTVTLDATGFTDLPGRFSINGGTFQPLPGHADRVSRSASRRPPADRKVSARETDADRAGRRGRELDRVLRRALPQERRLHRPHGRHRQRGARPVPGVASPR